MSKKIKIYRDPDSPRRYIFADGPKKGELAFALDGELNKGAIFPFSNRPERVFFHGFKLIDSPTPPNTITISSKCGQSQTTELTGIDPAQAISSITVRGQKWVPT